MLDRINKYKLPILAAFFLALVTSVPQFHLWWIRGSEWHGSCALSDPDELPYLAYANALIRGRPRRNNPFGDAGDSHIESLYSIQFFPAYLVALPSRILRISADTAFMLLSPLVTIATVLVVWGLLFEVTGRSTLSAVGAMALVSFASAAAHSPIPILQGIKTGYDPFPLLRRYIPAVPFPVFLASSLFAWRALTINPRWAIAAGLSFATLVYSYFFLWSSLAAWFFTLLVLWFFTRPQDRNRVLKVTGILVTIGGAALAPYVYLTFHRGASMDQEQLLEFRRTPDLLRAPELYGALILCYLIYHVRKGTKTYNDPRVLFTAAFLLAPFVVFNQQILTGRSLQPFHYEEFATNYWIVLAAFLAIGILREYISKRIMVYLAVSAIGFAIMLTIATARNMVHWNIPFDQVRPVALSLNERTFPGVVFAPDSALTHSIPAITNKPVLWARYRYTFSGSTDQKTRYYQQLYYAGVDEKEFFEMLRDDFTARWEVFGAERANPVLSASYRPVTEADIQSATKEYSDFVQSFDSVQAESPLLSYAIVSPKDKLERLDRWYERSNGEQLGGFIIYRLELKTSSVTSTRKPTERLHD